MIFEQIPVGGDRNFAYLVGDAASRQAALVDPAYRPELVLERAAAHGLRAVFLINTHGHHDHASGNATVLTRSGAALVAWARGGLRDGQELALGAVTLRLIHTPGHTPDSLCVLALEGGAPGKLITGDTLFVGKVGGTGYGRDAREEFDSLRLKLMTLPEDTEVWPGHDVGLSPSSTIGHEKRTNPFILRDRFEDFLELKRTWLEYKQRHGIA
jgi:glyoxylase-like metal-dependent hydrolase (beta-lactamase superfamily II)